MEETKLTANLPRMDIEMIRRDDPDQNMETMTIQMRATPSFKAVGDYLAPTMANPLLLMWAVPFALWARAVEAAWRPWLALEGPSPARERSDA